MNVPDCHENNSAKTRKKIGLAVVCFEYFILFQFWGQVLPAVGVPLVVPKNTFAAQQRRWEKKVNEGILCAVVNASSATTKENTKRYQLHAEPCVRRQSALKSAHNKLKRPTLPRPFAYAPTQNLTPQVREHIMVKNRAGHWGERFSFWRPTPVTVVAMCA